MKKTFFILAACTIAICISCKQAPIEEQIASLEYGERQRITDQEFCNQLINTADKDSIIIGTKKYLLKKQAATYGIKGTIIYVLTSSEERIEVKLTSQNSRYTNGWIEKM